LARNKVLIDLYQVHSIRTPEDVDSRIQNGILEVLLKAKEQGKIKYLGFTGHLNPFAHTRMLEQTAESNIFDTVILPVNVLDQSYYSFTKNVLPIALERNMGILAMKSLADGRFFALKNEANWKSEDPIIPNYMTIKEAMHFVWSMPVTVLISGNENATFMREKIALARSFSKLSEEEKMALVNKVSNLALNGKIEYYKKKEA
jgi:uncharacterized protein